MSLGENIYKALVDLKNGNIPDGFGWCILEGKHRLPQGILSANKYIDTDGKLMEDGEKYIQEWEAKSK